jgi:hypothetical protein
MENVSKKLFFKMAIVKSFFFAKQIKVKNCRTNKKKIAEKIKNK